MHSSKNIFSVSDYEKYINNTINEKTRKSQLLKYLQIKEDLTNAIYLENGELKINKNDSITKLQMIVHYEQIKNRFNQRLNLILAIENAYGEVRDTDDDVDQFEFRKSQPYQNLKKMRELQKMEKKK